MEERKMHWCQTDTIIKTLFGFYVNFYVNENIFDLGCMKMIDRGKRGKSGE